MKQLCYADPEKLTAMGNILREKLGTTKQYSITEMTQAINEAVDTGVDTSDATATSSTILASYTAYVNDQKLQELFLVRIQLFIHLTHKIRL